MGALSNRIGQFRSADDGVSAIEFAIVFPILLVLMLAGGQVVLYIDATRKVQQIATSASEMLSQAAPPTSGVTTASVNAIDLDFSYDASLVIFPFVMADAKRQNIAWRQDLSVNIASISFTKISSACDGQSDLSACYIASVDWTTTGTPGSKYRPCLVPQLPVDNSAPYNRFNLPRSLFGPGSVIAVDVSFTFSPTFGSSFVSPVTITRSAFVQPRYVTNVTFDSTNNDGIAKTCI